MPQYGAQKVEGLPFAIKGRAVASCASRSACCSPPTHSGRPSAPRARSTRRRIAKPRKRATPGPGVWNGSADLLTTDRERLLEDAKDEVLYRTFQSDSPIAAAVIHARDPDSGRALRAPASCETPINIMSFGVDHTPPGDREAGDAGRSGHPQARRAHRGRREDRGRDGAGGCRRGVGGQGSDHGLGPE